MQSLRWSANLEIVGESCAKKQQRHQRATERARMGLEWSDSPNCPADHSSPVSPPAAVISQVDTIGAVDRSPPLFIPSDHVADILGQGTGRVGDNLRVSEKPGRSFTKYPSCSQKRGRREALTRSSNTCTLASNKDGEVIVHRFSEDVGRLSDFEVAQSE